MKRLVDYNGTSIWELQGHELTFLEGVMNRKGSEKEKWQAGEQQTGEGNEVESGQGLGQALIVTGESPETCRPGKRAFDDPTAWQQDEAPLGFRVLDDLQSDAVRLGRFGRSIAGVALVHIGQFHRVTGDRLHLASELLHLLPLLSRGRGDHQRQQVPSVSTATWVLEPRFFLCPS
jgi:hypothetical protein